MCSVPSASARPAAAPAPPSAAASGASFSSFHSRQQQQEDAALLTLNTLLHAMVGTTLAIDCKDDRTVRVEIIQNGVQPKMSTGVLTVTSDPVPVSG